MNTVTRELRTENQVLKQSGGAHGGECGVLGRCR